MQSSSLTLLLLALFHSGSAVKLRLRQVPTKDIEVEFSLQSFSDYQDERKAPLVADMVAFERSMGWAALDAVSLDEPVMPPWVKFLSTNTATSSKGHASVTKGDEQTLFKKFDTNGDDNLSVFEVSEMAPSDPDRFCNAAVAVMCADADGSSSVNLTEFTATFSKKGEESEFQECYVQFEPSCHGHAGWNESPRFIKASTNITAKFKRADGNHDGQLSVKEFRSVAVPDRPTDVENPECMAAVSVTCADEDGSGSVNLVEFIDMFTPGDMMNDFKHCIALNAPACTGPQPNKTKAEMILDQPFSPGKCSELFAYQFSRDLCMKLQRRVCVMNCTNLVHNASKAGDCQDMKDFLCQVDKPAPTPKPLESGKVPNRTLKTMVTLCVAFPTRGTNKVWIAREGGLPKPLATKLGYLDCAQVQAFRGMELGIYSGASRVATHQCSERTEVVLVGESTKNRREKAVTAFSFHDEGMKRPILCHAAPMLPAYTVSVEGRKWYPFSNLDNLKGVISYLQRDVLALDHDDLQKEKEALEFRANAELRGTVPVSAEQSLFLLSAKDAKLGCTAHNLGHLKYL